MGVMLKQLEHDNPEVLLLMAAPGALAREAVNMASCEVGTGSPGPGHPMPLPRRPFTNEHCRGSVWTDGSDGHFSYLMAKLRGIQVGRTDRQRNCEKSQRRRRKTASWMQGVISMHSMNR